MPAYVDYSLLQVPNFGKAFQEGYEEGQTGVARRRARSYADAGDFEQAAYSLMDRDPQAAQNYLTYSDRQNTRNFNRRAGEAIGRGDYGAARQAAIETGQAPDVIQRFSFEERADARRKVRDYRRRLQQLTSVPDEGQRNGAYRQLVEEAFAAGASSPILMERLQQLPAEYNPGAVGMLDALAQSIDDSLLTPQESMEMEREAAEANAFQFESGMTHAFRGNKQTGQVELGGELPLRPQAGMMYGGNPAPAPGYRYNEDFSAQEPIPGGPAATRTRLAASSARQALDSRRARVQLVQRNIAEAIALSRGFGTTGAIGGPASNVPGNAAYNLRRKLDAIRANAGFDELLTLKAGGGTLGALSDSEREALESLIASLNQGQSDEQLRAALQDLQQYFAGSLVRMEDAYQRDYGDGGGGEEPGAATPAAPQQGGLQNLTDEQLDALEEQLMNGGR